MLGELGEAARRNRETLSGLRARLRSVAEADRAAAASIATLRERLARVERQQDDALRGERFEEADALNGTLEDLRSALAGAEGERRAAAGERTRLEAEARAIFSDSLAVATEGVLSLQKGVEERGRDLASFRREACSRAAAGRDRLSAEEEQLRIKEHHVARDTALVEEERQQVERAIADQTTELDASVAAMRADHAKLVGEVAELERLLEEKRRQGE